MADFQSLKYCIAAKILQNKVLLNFDNYYLNLVEHSIFASVSLNSEKKTQKRKGERPQTGPQIQSAQKRLSKVALQSYFKFVHQACSKNKTNQYYSVAIEF